MYEKTCKKHKNSCIMPKKHKNNTRKDKPMVQRRTLLITTTHVHIKSAIKIRKNYNTRIIITHV